MKVLILSLYVLSALYLSKADECSTQLVCQRLRKVADKACATAEDSDKSATLEYEEILKKVKEMYSQEIDEMKLKMKKMNKRLQRVEKQLQSKEICNFTYAGKCFFGVFPSYIFYDVNHTEAQKLCADKDGHLADMNDQIHYNMFLDYTRSLPMDNSIYVWFGMKYDSSAKKLTFTNGTQASFAPWFPEYPKGDSPLVVALIRQDVKDDSGLLNVWPGQGYQGVLCER